MYGNKIYSVIILFVSLEIFMCAGYYHDTTFIKKKILENYNTDADMHVINGVYNKYIRYPDILDL
jgi:hypothetical protein